MKMKKLTSSQLEKQLKVRPGEELAELIIDMYRKLPDAVDYLNDRMGDPAYGQYLLSEAKERIQKYVNPLRGGRVRLPEAKEVLEGFCRVIRDQALMADLYLHYAECSVSFLERYTIGPSYFSQAEKAFKSVIEILNNMENQDLFLRFRERMEDVVKKSAFADEGLHSYYEKEYQELKWIREADQKNVEATDIIRGTSGDNRDEVPGVSSATSYGTVSEDDSSLFYKLWFPLLDYANQKRKINDLKNIASSKSLDPGKVKEIANVVWDDPALIDQYLSECGGSISEDGRRILESWKRVKKGRFVLERHLKKGSIFISMEDSSVYLVKGLKSSWKEMLASWPSPIIIDLALLPFRDVIISDGLVMPMNLFMGSGAARLFKEKYMEAKRRGMICTAL